jgi:hypothetical protein
MKAKQLAKKFDDGEDIAKYLDVAKAHRPEQEQRRVNVDFPIRMIHSLDKEAKRLGVPRQSIIKVWVAATWRERRHSQDSELTRITLRSALGSGPQISLFRNTGNSRPSGSPIGFSRKTSSVGAIRLAELPCIFSADQGFGPETSSHQTAGTAI